RVSTADGGGGDKRPEVPPAQVRPKDSKSEVAPPPEDFGQGGLDEAAKRVKAFQAEAEAIRTKADAEIQARRKKLLEDLQALQEACTEAGKLTEAAAIGDRLRQLQADGERAQALLAAAKQRSQNLLVNGSFEEGPDTPHDGVHAPSLNKGSSDI